MDAIYTFGDSMIIQIGELDRAILSELWKLGSKLMNGLSAFVLSVTTDQSYFTSRRTRMSRRLVGDSSEKGARNFRKFNCTAKYTPRDNDASDYSDTPRPLLRSRSCSHLDRLQRPPEPEESHPLTTMFYILFIPLIVVYLQGVCLFSVVQLMFPLPFQFYFSSHSEETRLDLTGRSNGLLEDFQYYQVYFLTYCVESARSFWSSLFRRPYQSYFLSCWSPLTALDAPIHLKTVPSTETLRYAIEHLSVETEDHYLLPFLRLPRPESSQCIIFQAGLLDTAYAWISTDNTMSMAVRAYELGYDVYLTNFRGTTGHYGDRICGHVSLTPDDNEFWDFSIDDLTLDTEAFVNKVRSVKQSELSMGGAVTLIYLIRKSLEGRPHHLSRAVLMSPAGLHEHLSLSRRVLFSLFKKYLYCLPSNYPFPLRSSNTHKWLAKLAEDMLSSPSTLDLINELCSFIIGGESKRCPFQRINYTDYPLGVCSVKLMKHGSQCLTRDRFQSFDFGRDGNQLRYGRPTPIDYTDYYNLFNIPMLFLSGDADPLVPPCDVYRHHQLIEQFHPRLSQYKLYHGAGHLAFTFVENESILDDVFQFLRSPHPSPAAPAAVPFPPGYTKINSNYEPYMNPYPGALHVGDLVRSFRDLL